MFRYFSDDTDPYQEANDYPPSPESWIAEGGLDTSGPGSQVHAPYEWMKTMWKPV